MISVWGACLDKSPYLDPGVLCNTLEPDFDVT